MFSLAVAVAVATGPTHLSELLRIAHERNPELQAAAAQVRSSAAALAGARALDDPMLMIQLWNAPVSFSNVPLMIQLSQNVPLGGKLDARHAAALSDWQRAQADAAAKARDVDQEVSKVYFDLFLADRTIEIDATLEKTLNAMLSAAGSQIAAGRGEQVDGLRAQAEILAIEADRETAQAHRIAANARLAVLLDRDPDDQLGQTTSPALLAQLPDEATLRDRALTARPEVALAKAMIGGAEAQLQAAKASSVPDLGFSLAEMHTFGSVTGDRDFLFAGIQGNIPLFIHNKNRPKQEAAAAQIDAARAEEHALQNRILAEVAQAYGELRAEEHLVALHHRLVPVSKQALEAALASYSAGQGSFLVALDAERALQTHELDLATHLAAYEQHLAELEHAVGGDLGLARASESGTREGH